MHIKKCLNIAGRNISLSFSLSYGLPQVVYRYWHMLCCASGLASRHTIKILSATQGEEIYLVFSWQMSQCTHTHTHKEGASWTLNRCLGSFSYPEILLFFFICTDVKHTFCARVFVEGIWWVIGSYWFSFQYDCAVKTESHAQVGSDLRLSYCVCHDVECAVWPLWLDVVFLQRRAS